MLTEYNYAYLWFLEKWLLILAFLYKFVVHLRFSSEKQQTNGYLFTIK